MVACTRTVTVVPAGTATTDAMALAAALALGHETQMPAQPETGHHDTMTDAAAFAMSDTHVETGHVETGPVETGAQMHATDDAAAAYAGGDYIEGSFAALDHAAGDQAVDHGSYDHAGYDHAADQPMTTAEAAAQGHDLGADGDGYADHGVEVLHSDLHGAEATTHDGISLHDVVLVSEHGTIDALLNAQPEPADQNPVNGHEAHGHETGGHEAGGLKTGGHETGTHDVGAQEFGGHDAQGADMAGGDAAAAGHDFAGPELTVFAGPTIETLIETDTQHLLEMQH